MKNFQKRQVIVAADTFQGSIIIYWLAGARIHL